MDFARRGGFPRLGMAFCVGLHAVAAVVGAVVGRVLAADGFSVDSAACKSGDLPKDEPGPDRGGQGRTGRVREHVQSPRAGQALARSDTELNLLLGLCVGHDSLFTKQPVAPVTVLAVQDRVLGHNSLAAIYLADGYYCDRLFPAKAEAEDLPTG